MITRRGYRNALLRLTIAIVSGLTLAPGRADAAKASAPAGGVTPATLDRSASAPGPEPDDLQEPSPAAAPASTPEPRTGSRARRPLRPRSGDLPVQPFTDNDEARQDEADQIDGDHGDDAEAGPEGISDGEEDAGSRSSSTSLRALSCLEGEGGNDQDGARRGVQKRDFNKRHRFEISALGGYHASDALSSTYIYGAALAFFPSEDFGLEVLVARHPVRFRLEEAFTSFDREQHFQAGVAWSALGAMLWSPIHAKLRWNERRITHADLLLVAGGGQTLHGSVQGLTFQVGAGIKLYLARFVSLRLDVRDLLIPQEVLGQGRTTHNLVTMLGLCAWVPG